VVLGIWHLAFGIWRLAARKRKRKRKLSGGNAVYMPTHTQKNGALRVFFALKRANISRFFPGWSPGRSCGRGGWGRTPFKYKSAHCAQAEAMVGKAGGSTQLDTKKEASKHLRCSSAFA
jgi:hypothetical protein